MARRGVAGTGPGANLGWLGILVLGLALAPLARPAPAAAQAAVDRASIRVTGFGGVSLRQGIDRLRLAEDVLSVSARLTLPRRSGLMPWVQAERFVRPDLDCTLPLACNERGWTALGGVTAPLSGRSNDTGPGVHPYLLAGIGWAFSEENRFAYTMGVGAAFPIFQWLAPSLEVRWEDLPGIRNVVMINLGLRLDLL